MDRDRMESIGFCDFCGEVAEWWLETERFKVSLDSGVSAGELTSQVPICNECMVEVTEDDDDDDDEGYDDAAV